MKIVLIYEFDKYSLSAYYVIKTILLGTGKLLLEVNVGDSSFNWTYILVRIKADVYTLTFILMTRN